MYRKYDSNGWSKLTRKRMVVWMTPRGWIRIGIVALLVVLTATAFLNEMPSSRTWSHWSTPLTGKVIALDAGHGGADGGAVSKDGGEIEKDLNLAIVLYLRDYLQQAGAITLLTREGDYDLASPGTKGYSKRKTEDLKERVERLGQKKVDLTISIHMNSIPSPRWTGAQTFFYPSSPENERLAAIIQTEIRESLGNTDRIAKKAETIYLLKQLSMPTALVEVGFLSNPQEANLLADAQYQRKIATAIYRGILRYSSGETVKPML